MAGLWVQTGPPVAAPLLSNSMSAKHVQPVAFGSFPPVAFGSFPGCSQAPVASQSQLDIPFEDGGASKTFTRRNKQRLRKKVGKMLADQALGIVSNVSRSGNDAIAAPMQIVEANRMEPAGQPRARQSSPAAQWRQKGRGGQNASQKEKSTEDRNKSCGTLMAALCTSSLRVLSKALRAVKAELKVQILIWESLPRTADDGRTVLGVAVEGSVEAYMSTVIKSTLMLAEVDPATAGFSMSMAVQQPRWDITALNASLRKAIQDVMDALEYRERVSKIPSTILSTGRSADAAVTKNGSSAERQEIDALLLANQVKEEDLSSLRHACGIFVVEKSTLVPGKQSANPKHLQPARLNARRGLRLHVKNTFLEVSTYEDSDDDDGLCSHASSQRSSSVPTNAGRSCTSSTSGFDTDEEIGRVTGYELQPVQYQ